MRLVPACNLLLSPATVTLSRHLLAPSIALALAAGMLGCTDTLTLPGDAVPAHIDIVTGDAQAGVAGSVLPLPLVVLVTDSLDRPVIDQTVDFSVQTGGGSVSPASVTTGSDGRASASWTLGPSAGLQQVRAQAVGGGAPTTLLVAFSATAVSGSGSLIAAVSGNDQTAPVNSALADSLVVKVSDGNGNPVSGITIDWTAVGGGTVSPATVVTGTNGRAATARVLGPTSGPQSAQASGAGLAGSPVTFVHTAIPSIPTTLAAVSGSGQTAPAGFEVAEDLVVLLTDANGNGVGGRSVTWVVGSGGGTVNPVNATTDPNGFARTRWTLGSTAGQNSLTAVFSGIPPVPFSATGSADVPSKIALSSGDNQSAVGGQALATPLAVLVTDANNNPVANVSVSWTANVGGFVSAPTSATNAQGIAQITRTLGTTLGPYTTTADVPGLTGTPITFTSTATVGPAAQIIVITQPAATAVNEILLVQQPVVQVQDAGGNNVGPAGRTITAALVSPPAGAALNGDRTRQTDANGQAAYIDLSIVGPVGSYTIQFTSPGLTSIVSTSIALSVGAPNAGKSTVTANPTTVAAGDPSTITVTAKDAGGNPLSGVNVTIAADGNGNTLGQPGAPTDVSGQTTATFSSTSPGPHRVTATMNGTTTISTSATVTVTVGLPASIAINLGNNQTAAVGTAVATNPSVIVKDIGGTPVPGVSVTFAVASGGGSVTPLGGATTTNASGIATVGSWTLGTTAGTNNNTLTATATGAGISGNPVTFTASAVAGGAASIAVQAGNNQAAVVGTPVATNPAVIVRDASNNPASGVTVTFAVASGGGSVTVATPVTNALGIATVGSWTLGTTAGTNNNTLTATATGAGISGNPVTFTASANPGAPASIAVQVGNNQTAVVGTAVATDPAVIVRDASNNPVSGVTVTFAVASGGGSVTVATPVTNASGIATVGSWTVGTTAGTNNNTLTATATGAGISGNPVTFTASADPGAPASIAINGLGDGQTATAGTSVGTNPAVIVKDAFLNPVPGVTVTFVASGGGSVTPLGGVTTTNASGIATVGSWTLDPVPGGNTLDATATGAGISGNPVTFTATGT